MNGWWYAAAVMFAISTVLWLRAGVRLAAANPSARLPYFGRPPNQPGGNEWLQVLALGLLAGGVQFVAQGFWRSGYGNVYNVLWGLPFAGVVIVVGLVPYVRHNRRRRR
ncbi:hypothetical protein [Dactylosporangium sp. CA-139066]|uniref:hypothetical protein n=1 Tax=Dactylosporangium sp. CA-139066 TaxID=3239930 RepID=UPI003D905E09